MFWTDFLSNVTVSHEGTSLNAEAWVACSSAEEKARDASCSNRGLQSEKINVEQRAKRRLPRVCVHIGLREPECCPNSLLGRGDAPVDLESTDGHACIHAHGSFPALALVFPQWNHAGSQKCQTR